MSQHQTNKQRIIEGTQCPHAKVYMPLAEDLPQIGWPTDVPEALEAG